MEAVQIVLPIAEFIVAAYFIRSGLSQRFRVLVLYLLVEALAQIGVLYGKALLPAEWQTIWYVLQPVRMAIRTLLVVDFFLLATDHLHPREVLYLSGFLALTSASLCLAAWSYIPGNGALRDFLVARQYLQLFLVSWIGAFGLYCWCRPIGLDRNLRIYGTVAGLNAARMTITGSLVPGGLGYYLAPYSFQTWHIADSISWIGMFACVAAWGIGMRRERERTA